MSKRRTSITELDRSVAQGGRRSPPRGAGGGLQRLATEHSAVPARRVIAHAAAFDHGLPVNVERRDSTGAAPVTMSSVPSHAVAFDQAGAASTAFGDVWTVPHAVARALTAPGPDYVEPFDAPERGNATPCIDCDERKASAFSAALEEPELDDELDAIRRASAPPPTPAPEPEPELFPAQPRSAAAAAPEPPAHVEPAASPHDVFERMGRGMRFANTFDLGAIALSRRFDAFDAELAREASAPAPAHGETPSALEADDDLRAIGALFKLRQSTAASADDVIDAEPLFPPRPGAQPSADDAVEAPQAKAPWQDRPAPPVEPEASVPEATPTPVSVPAAETPEAHAPTESKPADAAPQAHVPDSAAPNSSRPEEDGEK